MSPRAQRALGAAAAIARPAGAIAALAASLLYVRAHVDALLAAIARVSPLPPMRMDIIAWRTQPNTQWRTYCVVMAFAAAAALAHEIALRLVRRWPIAVIAIESALVATAWAMASRASPFLGRAFALALVPAAVLVAPFVRPTRVQRGASDARATFAAASAMQAVSLAWGAWITTFSRPAAVVLAAQLAAWGFAIARRAWTRREEDEALAGVPFTLLPLVGVLREPGPGWLLVALAAYGALRVAIPRAIAIRAWRARAARVAIATGAWGVISIFTIPYRFRDLPKLNYDSHENVVFAPLASALHGKLMMADAGLMYGPLRTYAMELYVRVAGVTAEQARLGQILMNQGMLLLLFVVGWRLVERRLLPFAWLVYLTVMGTLVLTWINYSGYGMNAFGWADVGRIGWPFVAAVGWVPRLARDARARRVDRASARRLAAWGALAAASTLWAQEFGACALAAMAVVPVAHALIPRGSIRARVRPIALATAALFGGAIAVFALFLGWYAIRGRAGAFLHTVTSQGAAFTSGSYGLLQYPANESTVLSWAALNGRAPYEGTPLEYLLAPAVYCFTILALSARAVARRWTERDSTSLAMLVFGLVAFRFALGRADYLHLIASTLPAVALVPRLAVLGLRAVAPTRAGTRAIRAGAAVTAGLLAIASLDLSAVTTALAPRTTAILSGSERPSSGAPYVYPGLPRAGDVKVGPEEVALAEAIRAHSSPTDKIFQHVGYTEGGQIYFLTDRDDATRFDVLAEILTAERQHLLYEDLVANPPKLVCGSDWGMTGDEANGFLKTRYHSIGTFGGVELFERND